MAGSVEESRILSRLLDLSVDFAGLLVNQAKSTFVMFGLSQEEMAQLGHSPCIIADCH